MIVRSRSALGIKYLEIVPGESTEGYEAGSLMPLSAATPEPVEIDQFLGMFDAKTRTSIQTNLREFGNTFAGRGGDLNSAIGELAPLVERLMPVATLSPRPRPSSTASSRRSRRRRRRSRPSPRRRPTCSSPSTTPSPRSPSVARPFIQETITRLGPGRGGADRHRSADPHFLNHSAILFRDLRPGAQALADNAAGARGRRGRRRREPARRAGAQPPHPAGRRRPARTSTTTPASAPASDRLTQTMNTLDPTLSFVTPAQTVCNYAFLLFRNLESAFSGTRRDRHLAALPHLQPADRRRRGEQRGDPVGGLGERPEPGELPPRQPVSEHRLAGPGPAECEAGNEPYFAGQQVIGNVPGDQGT